MVQLPRCIDCAQWGLGQVRWWWHWHSCLHASMYAVGPGCGSCTHPCVWWGLAAAAACIHVWGGAWLRQLHAAGAALECFHCAQRGLRRASTWHWHRLHASLHICIHPCRWAGPGELYTAPARVARQHPGNAWIGQHRADRSCPGGTTASGRQAWCMAEERGARCCHRHAWLRHATCAGAECLRGQLAELVVHGFMVPGKRIPHSMLASTSARLPHPRLVLLFARWRGRCIA